METSHRTTADEDMSSACVITTLREPGYIVLLPVYYLRQRGHPTEYSPSGFSFTGFRPLWTLHPLSAFPSALTPFALPILELGQALTDMSACSMGSAPLW